MQSDTTRTPRFIVVIVLVMTVITAGSTYASFAQKPSQELVRLRAVEISLDLPKPAERKEIDTGCHKDSKGAIHYTRYIALRYNDPTTIQAAKKQIEAKNWRLIKADTFQNTEFYNFYDANSTYKAYLHIDHNSSDKLSHYIHIESLHPTSIEQCAEQLG